MALNDIENKIIKEAETEAARIVNKALKEQQKKISLVEKELAEDLKQAKRRVTEEIAHAINQKNLLFKLEAEKDILRMKRKYLDKLGEGVITEIKSNSSLRQKYYDKVLKQLQDENDMQNKTILSVASEDQDILKKSAAKHGLNCSINVKKDWALGRCEIVFENSMIDCSLDKYILEKIKELECKLIEEIF